MVVLAGVAAAFVNDLFVGFGGPFGGNGGHGGGGGAGLGGAIFLRAGTLLLQDSTLTQNTATPGSGASGAGNGQGKGGALFIHDDAIATGAGNTCRSNNASDAAATTADTLDFYGDGTGICIQPSVAVTVTINQAAGQADPATTSPVNFTAVFNAPITGFTSDDVTLGERLAQPRPRSPRLLPTTAPPLTLRSAG